MKYIIIDKANRHSIPLAGHRINGAEMVVNEKEIMSIPDLQGTLDERTAAVNGRECTIGEIGNLIKTGSWEIIQ